MPPKCDFGAIWDFQGSQNRPLGRHFRPKRLSKSMPFSRRKRPRADLGATLAPKRSKDTFFLILDRFWTDFALILDRFLKNFGTSLDKFWHRFLNNFASTFLRHFSETTPQHHEPHNITTPRPHKPQPHNTTYHFPKTLAQRNARKRSAARQTLFPIPILPLSKFRYPKYPISERFTSPYLSGGTPHSAGPSQKYPVTAFWRQNIGFFRILDRLFAGPKNTKNRAPPKTSQNHKNPLRAAPRPAALWG